MVCQPLELPEKMRQVLHKSTIAMLPDSLPLERVWARDYVPAPSIKTLQRKISATTFTVGAELQVYTICVCIVHELESVQFFF